MSNLNDNFKKWFGKSIMVTKDGSPKIFYHVTHKDFNEFKPVSWNNKIKDFEVDNEGGRQQYYFTQHQDWANNFAKKDFSRKQRKNERILQVYLKVENPLICTTTQRHDIDYWVDFFTGKGINFTKEELQSISRDGGSSYTWEVIFNDTNKLANKLKEAGYDAFIISDTKRSDITSASVIVFDSNQIKSIDNNGEWSSSNNIYETEHAIYNLSDMYSNKDESLSHFNIVNENQINTIKENKMSIRKLNEEIDKILNESTDWNFSRLIELFKGCNGYNEQQTLYSKNSEKNGNEWMNLDIPSELNKKIQRSNIRLSNKYLQQLKDKFPKTANDTDENLKPYKLSMMDSNLLHFGNHVCELQGIYSTNYSVAKRFREDFGFTKQETLTKGKDGLLGDFEKADLLQNGNIICIIASKFSWAVDEFGIFFLDTNILDQVKNTLDQMIAKGVKPQMHDIKVVTED